MADQKYGLGPLLTYEIYDFFQIRQMLIAASEAISA
jgi:hypothetical protein